MKVPIGGRDHGMEEGMGLVSPHVYVAAAGEWIQGNARRTNGYWTLASTDKSYKEGPGKEEKQKDPKQDSPRHFRVRGHSEQTRLRGIDTLLIQMSVEG